MGCFSSGSTQQSNNYNKSSSSGTSAGSFSNPALNNFQTGLMQNISKGMDQSNQPLYGQGAIAGYLNNLNSLANKSIESLQGNLARRGGLNSGAMTSGQTGIGLERMGQQANFMANVPLMNRQAQIQSAQTYGGLGNQLMSVAPRTQTTNQTSEGTGTGYQKNTSTPSIMSDIGQTIAIAGGIMGMPSSGMTQPAPPTTAQSNNNFANSLANAPATTPGMGPGGAFNPNGVQPDANYFDPTVPPPDPNAFEGYLAHGGPLAPGKWYIAGEKGPEAVWGGGPGAFAAGYKQPQPNNLMWNRA